MVSPDAASISGIATVIEATDGGEMVRVPGTRKPVATKPPPPPRVAATGLLHRIAAKLAKSIPHLGNSSGSQDPSRADRSETSTATPKGQRSVRCFECGQVLLVSSAARSTQCGRCTRYISLEDYEITSTWSQNIHTRGDIVIAKHGKLVGPEVACHHLTVNGDLSAAVDCSGDATFRGPARILGTMHCRNLRIERKARLIFPQGAIAESAEIYGQVDGDLLCSGPVCLHKTARVLGNITTSKLTVTEGALLSGREIIEEDIELPPLPKKTRRFDPHDS